MKPLFWNTAGKLARYVGDRAEQLHLWLYGISGDFDARADLSEISRYHVKHTD